MTVSNSAKLIPVIVIVSVLIVSIIATVFTQAQVERAKKEVIESKDARTAAISSRTELRLRDAINIMEFASKQNEMRNVQYAESVSEEFMGIPADVDLEKRQAARDLLAIHDDFDTVAFVLPNGDIYLIEPYTAQQDLPRLNFAFREWYQGVVNTNDTYIGEVVVSAATGHIVVPIAVPVWSADGSSLAGILVAAMDLNVVQKNLEETTPGINEYIIIVDHQASIVADTREGQSLSKELRSAAYLQNIKDVLSDAETRSSLETINGTEMFAYYQPISAPPHKWALISLQPYDDAFFVLNTISYQSVITISLMVIVSAISGYFLYRAFKSNGTLTIRLEKLITELKHQAAKLKEVDKEKEEFSAMITHELKTPLVPIIGYSELLLDGTLGQLNEKQKETIQVMSNSAASLSRLISDLLDARKLELGKMKFEKRDTSPKIMVEECLGSLQPLAQSKEVILTSKLEQSNDGLMIRCDAKRIRQVLDNLVNNGIKFVAANTGKIEVSVKKEGDSGAILFAVKDNGVGIPLDKQQNIFKKFYQADTSMTRNAGGTGLGLAICKAIIEAHDGKIWFVSEPGVGSTFYFSLPPSFKSTPALTTEKNISQESLAT